MRIWIDADAAPTDVKEIVFRAAKRLTVETVLVANTPVATPKSLPHVRSITVSAGANVADQYIVTNSEKGDVAITADLPFAAELVEKGVYVIDPRGDLYTPDTIASRLSMRNFMDELRGAVEVRGGAKPYSPKDKKAFAATFDRIVTKAMRSKPKS